MTPDEILALASSGDHEGALRAALGDDMFDMFNATIEQQSDIGVPNYGTDFSDGEADATMDIHDGMTAAQAVETRKEVTDCGDVTEGYRDGYLSILNAEFPA